MKVAFPDRLFSRRLESHKNDPIKNFETYHRKVQWRWRKSVNKVPDGTSGRVLSKWDTENDAGDHQDIAVQNKISIFFSVLENFQ